MIGAEGPTAAQLNKLHFISGERRLHTAMCQTQRCFEQSANIGIETNTNTPVCAPNCSGAPDDDVAVVLRQWLFKSWQERSEPEANFCINTRDKGDVRETNSIDRLKQNLGFDVW